MFEQCFQRIFTTVAPICLVLVFAGFSVRAQDVKKAAVDKVTERIEGAQKQAEDEKDKKELYAKLKERLTGVKFIGQFTMIGQEKNSPKPEEYHILSVDKMEKGDFWRLSFRVKYGGKDVVVPGVPFEIKWAGRTPVITVDGMFIPPLGTFDARVLIRRNMYSGTWGHNQIRGHLFGRIEKLSDDEIESGKKQLAEIMGAGDDN